MLSTCRSGFIGTVKGFKKTIFFNKSCAHLPKKWSLRPRNRKYARKLIITVKVVVLFVVVSRGKMEFLQFEKLIKTRKVQARNWMSNLNFKTPIVERGIFNKIRICINNESHPGYHSPEATFIFVN